jgi:hypothetical protein
MRQIVRGLVVLVTGMLTLGLLAATPDARADTVLFGVVDSPGNSFPVGGGAFDSPSNRYQQVYDNAVFLSQVADSLSVTGITFLPSGFALPFATEHLHVPSVPIRQPGQRAGYHNPSEQCRGR